METVLKLLVILINDPAFSSEKHAELVELYREATKPAEPSV